MGDHKKKHKKKHKKESKESKKKKHKKKHDKKHDKKRSRDSSEERERKREKKRLKEAKAMLKRAETKKEGDIDEGDYFSKSLEFRVWLRKEKDKFIDEIETKKSRTYFKKFVKKWNSRQLDDMYYKGINRSSFDAELSRTRHKWNFKLDTADERKIEKYRDTVDSETFSAKNNAFARSAAQNSHDTSNSSSGHKKKPASQQHENENDAERRERLYQERKQQHVDRKQWGRHNKSVMDELVPKADPGSFAARIEKRKQKGAYARKRSESPEMRSADVMGGGPSVSEFKKMVNQRKQKRQRYDNKMQKKLVAHKEKEAGIMDRMKALMEQNKHKYEL